MDCKGSMDIQRRRGSTAPSITSSVSTVSTLPPAKPKVKIFSPDGTDRISTISVKYNDVYVTLEEPGKKDITRTLRLTYSQGDEDNKDKMAFWHRSIVDALDRDPTGRRNASRASQKDSVDPGYLPYLFQGGSLNCLEVLTGSDTSGKWMIRPIAVEKRQAIFNAKQIAKENTKEAQVAEALSFLELAEEEERLQKARLERQARRKAKAEEAASRQQAAPTQNRQKSNDSLGSMFKHKGARVSVSSLASTQTSSTLPGRATNDARSSNEKKKHRSLRQRMFRQEKD